MRRDCHLIGGRDKGSVSAGGKENVFVREGRCSDSFIHAPDCGGGRERSQEDRETGEGVENECLRLAHRLTMSMFWLKDGSGLYLHA